MQSLSLTATLPCLPQLAQASPLLPSRSLAGLQFMMEVDDVCPCGVRGDEVEPWRKVYGSYGICSSFLMPRGST